MDKILKNQYDQIAKQLVLLQDFATMRYFPYSPLGAVYIQRRLKAIEATIDKTEPIEFEEGWKERLQVLKREACDFRLREDAFHELNQRQRSQILEVWAKKWRSILEPQFLFSEPMGARYEIA